MPFKDDSPFKKWTGKSNMDLENGQEVEKPLLEPQDEVDTEGLEVEKPLLEPQDEVDTEGLEVEKPLLEPQDEVDTEGLEVDDARVEDEGEHHLVKHVHFSESLQRALEKKEWDEEQGLDKDEEEEEEDEDFQEVIEFWEWVKAEAKCYANYICPVVLVNACILLFVIAYFYSRKS